MLANHDDDKFTKILGWHVLCATILLVIVIDVAAIIAMIEFVRWATQ